MQIKNWATHMTIGPVQGSDWATICQSNGNTDPKIPVHSCYHIIKQQPNMYHML